MSSNPQSDSSHSFLTCQQALDYLLNQTELTDAQRTQLDAHLNHCTSCQQEAADQEDMTMLFSDYQDQLALPLSGDNSTENDFANSIMTSIAQEEAAIDVSPKHVISWLSGILVAEFAMMMLAQAGWAVIYDKLSRGVGYLYSLFLDGMLEGLVEIPGELKHTFGDLSWVRSPISGFMLINLVLLIILAVLFTLRPKEMDHA